jgi:hypothetical protein
VRKKILSASLVSGSTYDLVIDSTAGASDTSFVPSVGQFVCPWSDSLALLVSTLLAQVDALGPGEQTSDLFDPGVRRRRGVDARYPYTIEESFLAPFFAVPALKGVKLKEPTTPLTVSTGSAGVSVYLFQLRDFVIYPQ